MALKRIDPEILLLGEIWLNSESYLGPNQIDGVMNYPLLGAMSKMVLGQNGAPEIAEELCGLILRYKQGHNAMMLNLLSSHDIERFTRLCQGDKAKVLAAYAVVLSFPGMPCIYYGDEIFLDGGGDPDCRRALPWDSEEFASEEHALFRQMIAFHNAHSCLKEGEIDIVSNGGLLIITRANAKESVSLYVNLSKAPTRFTKEAKLSFGLNETKLAPLGFVFC